MPYRLIFGYMTYNKNDKSFQVVDQRKAALHAEKNWGISDISFTNLDQHTLQDNDLLIVSKSRNEDLRALDNNEDIITGKLPPEELLKQYALDAGKIMLDHSDRRRVKNRTIILKNDDNAASSILHGKILKKMIDKRIPVAVITHKP